MSTDPIQAAITEWIRVNVPDGIVLDSHKDQLRVALRESNPFEVQKYVDNGHLSLEDDLVHYHDQAVHQYNRISRDIQPTVREKLGIATHNWTRLSPRGREAYLYLRKILPP
jgi:hypothetical protein